MGRMGRQILPLVDFGVRNGFRIVYGKRSMLKLGDLLRYREHWKPYRTAAAWYLWRAADQAKKAKKVLAE